MGYAQVPSFPEERETRELEIERNRELVSVSVFFARGKYRLCWLGGNFRYSGFVCFFCTPPLRNKIRDKLTEYKPNTEWDLRKN